jgi:hypothetical protein
MIEDFMWKDLSATPIERAYPLYLILLNHIIALFRTISDGGLSPVRLFQAINSTDDPI